MWTRGRGSGRRGYHRAVTEYQITSWREVPSLVTARDGDEVVKSALPARFQEAVDEAAMRLGDAAADDYLAGWRRGDWVSAEGTPAAVADDVCARTEAEWTTTRMSAFLDALIPMEGAQ